MFEEDTGSAAVYRPDTGEVPLSRRPRGRLTLSPDGRARVTDGGPDDRPAEVPAEWTREGDELIVRARDEHGGADRVLRVSIEGPTRLLVRSSD